VSDPNVTEWISAITSALSTLGLFGGFIFAYWQLTTWKTEARARRRSEVAEEMIVAANNASDALRMLRSPIDRIPREHAGDKLYAYSKRYERLIEQNELFETLRLAQVRCKALLGIPKIDDAVDELFAVRGKIATALEILAEYAEESLDDQNTRDMVKEMRGNLYGSYGAIDALGVRQLEAVTIIEKQLTPIARFEAVAS
jgi:hypothetical protein